MTDDNVTNIDGTKNNPSRKEITDKMTDLLLETLERDLNDLANRVRCIQETKKGNLKAAMEIALTSLSERGKNNKEQDNESK